MIQNSAGREAQRQQIVENGRAAIYKIFDEIRCELTTKHEVIPEQEICNAEFLKECEVARRAWSNVVEPAERIFQEQIEKNQSLFDRACREASAAVESALRELSCGVERTKPKWSLDYPCSAYSKEHDYALYLYNQSRHELLYERRDRISLISDMVVSINNEAQKKYAAIRRKAIRDFVDTLELAARRLNPSMDIVRRGAGYDVERRLTRTPGTPPHDP